MPLEIKEIVVNASVTESFMDQSEGGGGAASAAASENLIAECVEQVLEVLREKNER